MNYAENNYNEEMQTARRMLFDEFLESDYYWTGCDTDRNFSKYCADKLFLQGKEAK